MPDRVRSVAVVGEFLDQQHDVAEAVREWRGQAVERPARDRLDVVGGRRWSEAALARA